ncbi:hypothetical protein B0H13DRAFT_1859007 [Mycena leptocephala]|nr:hypothetical protein B0H13DRAFT_1859007 [Mycena leptocephala]
MAKNGCIAQYLNSAEGIAAWILVLSGIIGSVKSQQVIWAPGTTIQLNRLKIQTRNGEKWVFYPDHYWCAVVSKVIWAPTAKSKRTDSKSGLKRTENGYFTQYLNSAKGIPAWIYLLSISTEQKSKETDSKIWARYGHNGCFTQYLTSAKGIPAWIWVLSVIIDSKSGLERAKNGCFTQYLNSAKGIPAWIWVLRIITESEMGSQKQNPRRWIQNPDSMAENGCFTQYLNFAKGIAAWIWVLSGMIGSVKSQQVIWAPGTTIQLNGLKIQTRNGEKWVFYPVFKFC